MDLDVFTSLFSLVEAKAGVVVRTCRARIHT